MSEYENHRTFFGRGHDEYNFEVDLMKDSSDLLYLIDQAKDCEEEMENGAVLLITDKQYIMAYNRGRGRGPHDATIARIFADITDKKTLGFLTIMLYCHKAEASVLHARIYSEKETKMSKISNIISFSFNREKIISQEEFNSFMDFYNEYAWVIKREKFKVSLMGKSMTIEDVKDVLESMIDKNFCMPPLFDGEETIFVIETNQVENIVKK